MAGRGLPCGKKAERAGKAAGIIGGGGAPIHHYFPRTRL